MQHFSVGMQSASQHVFVEKLKKLDVGDSFVAEGELAALLHEAIAAGR
jgi:hypothetical protein